MPRATTATIAATLVVVPLLLLIIATESINAFSLNNNNNNNNHYRHPDKRKMKTRLFYEVFPDIPPKDDSGLSYAERSRPYRRVVFTHEDWIRHRSPDRFSGRFLKFIQSGIVRALINEVALVTCVATFILFYNALFVYGVDGFGSGVQYDPVLSFDLPAMRLPMIFFSLSSPALSLLLVFKTNTSYQRWDEARKNWGVIVNNSRTIMRQGSVWIQQSNISMEEKQRLMERLAAAVWAFSRAMSRQFLSANEDEQAYCNDVHANLQPELAKDLVDARHRPARALFEISSAINEFPLSGPRRVAMDSAATALCDAMGSSERIFTSPVPRFYTRHTARFLEVWLLLMPFTLYDAFGYTWNHIGMIPATVVISFFLLGIEELGIQLEEPFSLLPQHKITDGIGLSAEEHVDWFLKDDNNIYQQGRANAVNAALDFPSFRQINRSTAENMMASNQTMYYNNGRTWN